MNTKQQGDIGEAAAILHFTKLTSVVSVPLTNSARYDILVDDGNGIWRVQCKTASFYRNEAMTYEVQLATSGGNRSGYGKVKPISASECDMVFIYCMNGDQYLIPVSVVDGKRSLRMGPKQDIYKL